MIFGEFQMLFINRKVSNLLEILAAVFRSYLLSRNSLGLLAVCEFAIPMPIPNFCSWNYYGNSEGRTSEFEIPWLLHSKCLSANISVWICNQQMLCCSNLELHKPAPRISGSRTIKGKTLDEEDFRSNSMQNMISMLFSYGIVSYLQKSVHTEYVQLWTERIDSP